MRKKVISILLTAAMAVTLFAGCGDEKSADSQGNQSSGDAKTVTMMSWYSEDQMDDVIDAIEKKLGGEYKIDYTYVTNSDYNNVLSTQLAAGEGPDIIADGANFPARIKAGNVKDITDTGITDGFSDEGLALCTIDGKITEFHVMDGLLVFFTIKIFLKRQALKRFRLHMMNFLKHATS